MTSMEKMDYKYIEQLIERYWEGVSTLQEERILQNFFSQEDIPEHLKKYRTLFSALDNVKDTHLDKSFDDMILAKIDADTTTAHRIGIRQRMRPLYRAAAMVAIVLTIGMAAEHSFVDPSDSDSSSGFAVQGDSIPENPDAEFTEMPANMQNSSAKATPSQEDSL